MGRLPAMGATSRASGPAWLGIGAQRSGTTWFSQLLVQHPEMGFSSADKKETHALYRLGGLQDEDAYLKSFDGDLLRGEWTPFYLRALNTPPIALRLCRPEAPLLVLLRDPVERFASAMRLWVKMQRRGKLETFRFVLGDAQWAGMYADQLAAWRDVVGRDRLEVLVYEKVREDPATACKQVWSRLGLDTVPLSAVDERSYSSAGHIDWEWPEGLRATLTAVYTPQVQRLRDEWQLDVARWPNFQDL
jgi:Sulfotransferase domain